jgi:hypothetical protein
VRRLLASTKEGVELSAIEAWIRGNCERGSDRSDEGRRGASLESEYDLRLATAP